MVSDLVDVGCLGLEGILCAFYLGYDAGHLIDFLYPMIDVGLIFVDIVLNNRDIIYDFLGILRHDLDLSYELTLLFHVHLLQLQNQFILVISQLLVGCVL